MENSITKTNPKKNIKSQIEINLKSAIQSIFNQLKFGCYRNKCYNPHCIKSGSKNINF